MRMKLQVKGLSSILDLNVIDSRGEMTSGMKTGKLERHC